MMNPALAKIFFLWFLGGAAVFCVVLLVRLVVGEDLTAQVLVLAAGVATILALLVGFNVLKKKL
jgi:hypothetical protein